MNKGIITEVHRIKEIMGISTEKILSESIGGLLDDIIGLLKTGSKLPPDVETELIDLLKQNGRNENDLPVFLEKYKNATKEQDKNTIIQAYFGKSRSEINSAVTAAIRILDPVVQGAVYSKLILGSQNETAWKAIEYLRNMVQGGKEIDETLAKEIDQQLKYWDQVKSNYLSSNPANSALESQIFLIDNRYKELRSELDEYKMNAKSFVEDATGNKFFEKVLSEETTEGKAQLIWNRFSKSQNPNEQKIFKELQKKFATEDDWIKYVKSQFDDTAKMDEMFNKVKDDISLLLKGEKSKVRKMLDIICTKRRYAPMGEGDKTRGVRIKGFGIETNVSGYAPGELIETQRLICTLIGGAASFMVFSTILPYLSPSFSTYIQYNLGRLEKSWDNFWKASANCLDEDRMNEWKNDPKYSPYNLRENYVEYEDSLCDSIQIKYKDFSSIGSEGKLEWDGVTWLRLTDVEGELKGVTIFSEKVKNAIEQGKESTSTTTQTVVNKLDSAAQSLGINTGNDTQPSEPTPTQNNTDFRTRRKKQ